jgi:hypothetical protein
MINTDHRNALRLALDAIDDLRTSLIFFADHIDDSSDHIITSDDSTDYLPASASLLSAAIAALCDDDPNAAATALRTAIESPSCDDDRELADDALTAQFSSPMIADPADFD